MTDEITRRPRTATVALLAPAAAAVLAGSLAWAAGHPPTPPSTKPAAAVSSPGSAVERLRQEVASLRAELRTLGRTGTGGRNGSPGPVTTQPRTGAPPVHATTGAS